MGAVFHWSLDRIEAKRRKTALGSPEGEQSESINKISRIGGKLDRKTGLAKFTGVGTESWMTESLGERVCEDLAGQF